MTMDLNSIMEIDHVITVGADGTVSDGPAGLYAPEVWHVDGARSPEDIDIMGTGWEPLTGYTGQHAYSGAVMHASEYVGGRLERDILATPGTYVAVVVAVLPESDDDDPEPAGWAVLRHV